MGCGISRYGFANQVEACTFHPFRRKIVEISRDDIGDGTNSTKLLLKNNGAEDDADSNGNDKTSSSPLNNKVNPEMVDSSDASARKDKDQAVEIISKNNEVWAAAESGGDNDKQESNEDDDDDERRISNFDGWIGSPSFREYCVDNDDSEDHDNSSKNGNSTEGEKEETKTKREKTSASPKPNEACARQVPPNKAVKKGKRGRKFRKVFSIGRPTSMRNFMHGATCHNPNASSASGNKPAGKPIEKTD